MNWLWLLKRLEDRPVYDCNDAMIVAAPSEVQARMIASSREYGDEDSALWADEKRSSITLLGMALPNVAAGIVLQDFHAG